MALLLGHPTQIASIRSGDDHPLHAIPRLRPCQFTLLHHEVDMCLNLGKGKAHLMRIELMVKNDRYELRGRSRPLVARLGNRGASPVVMLDQFVNSNLQTVKWKLMSGQH